MQDRLSTVVAPASLYVRIFLQARTKDSGGFQAHVQQSRIDKGSSASCVELFFDELIKSTASCRLAIWFAI